VDRWKGRKQRRRDWIRLKLRGRRKSRCRQRLIHRRDGRIEHSSSSGRSDSTEVTTHSTLQIFITIIRVISIAICTAMTSKFLIVVVKTGIRRRRRPCVLDNLSGSTAESHQNVLNLRRETSDSSRRSRKGGGLIGGGYFHDGGRTLMTASRGSWCTDV
jgi:hypothetical protein